MTIVLDRNYFLQMYSTQLKHERQNYGSDPDYTLVLEIRRLENLVTKFQPQNNNHG